MKKVTKLQFFILKGVTLWIEDNTLNPTYWRIFFFYQLNKICISCDSCCSRVRKVLGWRSGMCHDCHVICVIGDWQTPGYPAESVPTKILFSLESLFEYRYFYLQKWTNKCFLDVAIEFEKIIKKKEWKKKMIPMIIYEYFKMLKPHLPHNEEAAETIGEHLWQPPWQNHEKTTTFETLTLPPGEAIKNSIWIKAFILGAIYSELLKWGLSLKSTILQIFSLSVCEMKIL